MMNRSGPMVVLNDLGRKRKLGRALSVSVWRRQPQRARKPKKREKQNKALSFIFFSQN
jgi:hypothetical protein